MNIIHKYESLSLDIKKIANQEILNMWTETKYWIIYFSSHFDPTYTFKINGKTTTNSMVFSIATIKQSWGQKA